MIPTFIGVILILIGLPIVVFGGTAAVLALFIACGPFSNSAAFLVPAIAASVSPMHLALGLLFVRASLSNTRSLSEINAALRANWAFLGFAAYGALMAYIGPRLFAGDFMIPPLRMPRSANLFLSLPLASSAQNMTTAVYSAGSALCAVAAFFLARRGENWRTLVSAAVWTGWLNIVFGILSVVGRGTPIDAFVGLFRNGAYAQVVQDFNGFVRMTGAFPEASAFATYTFGWFCFIFECWLRDVLPRRTGPLALALFVILLLSTSGSAYVGLAAFALAIAPRLLPWSASYLGRKVYSILAALLGAIVLFALLLAATPGLVEQLTAMIAHMTLDKADSPSGLQRSFWARKSIEAFFVSYGLGIGPGSFRSSGLIVAIAGSMGLIGLTLFGLGIAAAFKPFRKSTYLPVRDPAISVGIAASWATVLAIAPAAASAPSSDFGLQIGIFAGAALALRPAAISRRIRVGVLPRDATPGEARVRTAAQPL